MSDSKPNVAGVHVHCERELGMTATAALLRISADDMCSTMILGPGTKLCRRHVLNQQTWPGTKLCCHPTNLYLLSTHTFQGLLMLSSCHQHLSTSKMSSHLLPSTAYGDQRFIGTGWPHELLQQRHSRGPGRSALRLCQLKAVIIPTEVRIMVDRIS